MGDFNDLLFQDDKRGPHPYPNWLCVGFQEVMGECDLIDIPLEGHPFTWTKSRGTTHMIEERFDRSLANPQRLQLFPTTKLINLIATHSDHSPILLKCDTVQIRRNRRSFKFENWWLKEEGVQNVVQQSWVAVNHQSVFGKLADCASDLDRWNKLRTRQNNDDKDRLLGILRCRGCNDPVSTGQYMEAHMEYNNVLIREDTY
ncbi:uncharacterized protein LOC131618721 [Vicia villosa]|uniref:uncharacterized protein LOC131618721 n=1 Tax=Vicia villosa TaxID=3911 RepID=UPI00273A7B20|nr:uncharacterized protein LOC131618721 [Vicia villosa]